MSDEKDPKRQKRMVDGGPAAPVQAPTVEEVIMAKAMNSDRSGVFMLLTRTVVKDGNTFMIEKEEYAFFMKAEGNVGIRFRHEGGLTGEDSPSVVYLAAKKEDGDFIYQTAPESRTHIAVYYSASGSGKTVELAVSTVTRAAHLSLLATLGEADDIKDAEINDRIISKGEEINPKTWKHHRNELAYSKLSDAVWGVVYPNKESFVDIIKAGLGGGGNLRLVVGIDEASNCPMIVRSIISNQDWAARVLRGQLFCKLQLPGFDFSKVQFQFSIAGTGAASATTGSLDKSFEHMQTSAVKFPYLYPLMALEQEEIRLILPGDAKISAIKLDTIKNNLPILYTTMENARMASIALKILRDLAKSERRTLVEKSTVNKVCRLFIKSNGLGEIGESPVGKNAVGACAFAMLLFQDDIPDFTSEQAEEKDKYYSDFSCGFNFDLSVVKSFFANDQKRARFKLVSKYGLLEPNDIKEDRTSGPMGPGDEKPKPKPFTMRASQQLIALSLLGVDLSELVRSDPFGFEVLSTHTMKAALAASSVVAWEARKSVKDALEKVGCMVDQNATHKDTVDDWNDLKHYFVVRHGFRAILEENGVDRRWCGGDGVPTRLLHVELEVGRSDDDTKNVLFIERPYREELSTAYPDAGWDFQAPIAAVNYGNSALADGYITCFVAKKDWAEEVTDGAVVKWKQDPVRFTPMNQAKDKLGFNGKPKGQLPVTKLKKHAERCMDPVLNGLFGKKRLLFVSMPENMNARGRVSVERRWLPRAMVNCKILEGLMGRLSIQRTKAARMDTYTDCVDEDGTVISSIL